MKKKVLAAGETAGDYAADWRKTFDAAFLLGWTVAVVALAIVTLLVEPELFQDYRFLTFSALKLIIMALMAAAGGLVCRHFCSVDRKGYIATTRKSWFKVNYTRKLQHFAAYLVPLISIGEPDRPALGIIPHIWEVLFVLLVFLLLIQPIRERSRFFMLQFNSLDRPEDRPHTLKWIVMGNLLPGLLLSLVFRSLYENRGFSDLVLIIILIIGIGDGLAEPVGIYLGKHTFRVPSWFSSRSYLRSIEGSACVFISSIVIVLLFYRNFHSPAELITALLVVPLTMTVVEAVAPHSMDTPALMVAGFSALYGVVLLV